MCSSILHHKKCVQQDHDIRRSVVILVFLLCPQKVVSRLPSLLVAESIQLPLSWNMFVHPHIQKYLQDLDIIKLHL